jgi:hypothetical protein
LWRGAGLVDVETRVITVERTYDSFDDLWGTLMTSPSVKASMAKMSPAQGEELKDRVRSAFPAAADGRITYPAWANAVKGRVAG